MEKTIPFLAFLNSSNRPGEFVDVTYYLHNIGFEDHKPITAFLRDMEEIGYIRRGQATYSKYIHDSDNGFPTGEKDYIFQVQITAKGEQYLIDNDRTGTSLRVSKRAVQAAWFSGLVALLSFGFNIFQFAQNAEIGSRISKQDSTIISLQLRLSSLHNQIESSSASQKRKSIPISE